MAYNLYSERDFVSKHIDIPEDHFISINSPSLSNDLEELVPGNSINLVLSLSTSTQLQNIWIKLAPNGTLVLVGENDMPAFETFNMSVFSRGASIKTINLSEMLQRKKSDVEGLVLICYHGVHKV